MRDLFSSMLRLSVTMSQMGARQATDLLNGRESWDHTAAASFDAVRHAAEEGMTPMTRNLFQTGRQLQRGAVDLAFDLARQTLDPRAALAAVQRLAGAVGRPDKR